MHSDLNTLIGLGLTVLGIFFDIVMFIPHLSSTILSYKTHTNGIKKLQNPHGFWSFGTGIHNGLGEKPAEHTDFHYILYFQRRIAL